MHKPIEILAAFGAILPATTVAFVMMVGAKRFVAVIPMATVRGIGEQHILVFVVANPLAATFRAGEFALLAAQPATGGIGG